MVVDTAPSDTLGEDSEGATGSIEPIRPGRPTLADAPAWIGGLALVALFLFWAQRDGGYDVTLWAPGALLVLGLLTVVVIGLGGVVRLGRLHWSALLALLGFSGWSYVSMLWADVQGDAWTGANRTLLYALVFTLALLLPWTAWSGTVATWAFAGGVTLLAAYAMYRVATTEDDALFIDGRMAEPTGYPNANVALFMIGFWLALPLATRREQPVPIRALALGAAAFLPQASLVVQSRAAAVAVPLAAVVALAATPERLRTGLGMLTAAVPLVVGWSTHAEVYEQAEAGGAFVDEAVVPSARFMAVSFVLAVGIGLVWAIADRRVELSPRTLRALHVGAVALVVGGVVAGAVLVARADPVERVRVGWNEFTTNETEYEGASRFGSLDGERWDHWRVAMGRFGDRPVTGIGVEQFNVDYLRERRTSVDARYAHSLEVGILSQLGVVGALLFGAFSVAATLLVLPRRSDPPLVRTLRTGVFCMWAYWLIHSSADWFYEIPGITAPVLFFVALAAALGSRPPGQPTAASSRRGWRSVALVGAAAVALAAALSIAAPYGAERQLDQALAGWRADPAEAYDRLERARALNPLSDEPDLYAGAIAARLDDRPRMRLHFARALERNPYNWYAHLELGLTHSVDGRRSEAIREVRRALALNPREPLIVDVLRRLRRGATIPPRRLDRLFVERIVERLR